MRFDSFARKVGVIVWRRRCRVPDRVRLFCGLSSPFALIRLGLLTRRVDLLIEGLTLDFRIRPSTLGLPLLRESRRMIAEYSAVAIGE